MPLHISSPASIWKGSLRWKLAMVVVLLSATPQSSVSASCGSFDVLLIAGSTAQLASWELPTLQRALRRAPDGLPQVSTYTILCVLHEAGYTWQQDRTWCDTGKAIRVRKSGPVEVTDPDAVGKKT